MTAIPDRVSAESTAPIRPGAMATPRGAPVVRRRHPHGRVRRPGASIAAATVAFVVGMGGVVIGLRSTHAFRAATDWAIDLPNVRLAVTWLDDPSRLPFLHRSLVAGIVLIVLALLVFASVRWAGWLLLAAFVVGLVLQLELIITSGWSSLQPLGTVGLALTTVGLLTMLTTPSLAWLRSR